MATPDWLILDWTRLSLFSPIPSMNRRFPPPTTTGWTISVSSSRRPSSSRDRTTEGLPETPMFLPVCCFRLLTWSLRGPSIRVEFIHATSFSVLEATYFGVLLMWLAYGSSWDVGQKPAHS